MAMTPSSSLAGCFSLFVKRKDNGLSEKLEMNYNMARALTFSVAIFLRLNQSVPLSNKHSIIHFSVSLLQACQCSDSVIIGPFGNGK